MEFFSPGHLIVIAIVALVLFFGWKQLPEMSRSLGRSLRIFKTEIKGMSEDDKAREQAKSPPAEPPALEAPRAQPSVIEPAAEIPTADAERVRPRPGPGPNGASSTVNGRPVGSSAGDE
ncbi:MAG TPA: Sec-independent protein translocase subunit TatA [Jatrophihabitans sp.]|nr:Sec-independent protein translocase subunit TatA [Jatrophihabitans sp.]